MDRLVTWLNSLSPAENIIVSLSMALAFLTAVGAGAALFLIWMDRKGDETQVIYPSEDDLKRRREEDANRAYKRFTTGKAGKVGKP